MHCNCNGRDLEPPLVVESQLLPSCNLAKISLRSDAVWKTIQHILERGRKLSRPLTLVFARVTTQPSSVLSLNELLQVSINRDVLSSISCLSKNIESLSVEGWFERRHIAILYSLLSGCKNWYTHRTNDHLIGFTIYGCRICTICRSPNLVQEWDAREVMGRKHRLEGLFVTLVWDIVYRLRY